MGCFIGEKVDGEVFINDLPDEDAEPVVEPIGFLEIQPTETFNKEFTDHEEVIKRLNSIPNKTWKAGLNGHIEGTSLLELN
jgi:hypothetical protein